MFSHYYTQTKVDSYNSLPIEEKWALHNVITLHMSVLNKYQNNYNYNIFYRKCSYQLAKKSSQIFFDIIIMLRFGETKLVLKVMLQNIQ